MIAKGCVRVLQRYSEEVLHVCEPVHGRKLKIMNQ